MIVGDGDGLANRPSAHPFGLSDSRNTSSPSSSTLRLDLPACRSFAPQTSIVQRTRQDADLDDRLDRTVPSSTPTKSRLVGKRSSGRTWAARDGWAGQ
jgi:hypothetical protein